MTTIKQLSIISLSSVILAKNTATLPVESDAEHHMVDRRFMDSRRAAAPASTAAETPSAPRKKVCFFCDRPNCWSVAFLELELELEFS